MHCVKRHRPPHGFTALYPLYRDIETIGHYDALRSNGSLTTWAVVRGGHRTLCVAKPIPTQDVLDIKEILRHREKTCGRRQQYSLLAAIESLGITAR